MEAISLTRKEHDKFMPLGDADAKVLQGIKSKWSLGGVVYMPRNDRELAFLKRVFKKAMDKQKLAGDCEGASWLWRQACWQGVSFDVGEPWAGASRASCAGFEAASFVSCERVGWWEFPYPEC